MIKKLLKLLLIWWLFIPCVSFWYWNLTDWFKKVFIDDPTVISNNTYLFDSNLNFITDNYPVYYHNTWGTSNWRFFAWKDWWLYFYSRKNNNSLSSQWFVNAFCVDSVIENCINGTFNKSLDDVLSNIWSLSYVYIGTNTSDFSYAADYANSYLCFYDSENYYCAACSTEYGCIWWYTWLNLWINVISLEDFWSLSWDSSPLFKNNPTYDIWQDKYTYWQIVEWYEACGLDFWYCYWWFPIDDIFEPNQSIEDFTWYKFWYGANIRYLYSLYSDTYTPKEFFNQMIQAYNNWQINRFKTEPKALIMFVQQYVSWKSRGLLNVWFYDLWDYCNIKLWYNDLSAEYTWHNQTPKACYNFKKTNEKDTWWFQFTWDNAFVSIVGTWWSWNRNAWEFFWNIWSMFQNWIGTINTNYTWIIPAYILFFMFALILLRIITH